MIRTTEQIAMETVPRLIHQLAELTKEQPTTAEIEEAVMTSRALTAALGSWASSRHLIGANAHMAAQFSETHPMVAAAVDGLRRLAAANAYAVHPEIAAQMAALDRPVPLTEEDIASPELDEEFNRIERTHLEPGFRLDLRDLA
jgi:hypothetical protein